MSQTVEPELFKCSLCKSVFYYKRYLREHERRVHKFKRVAIKPFECDLCEKSFSTSLTRNRHMAYKHGRKVNEINLNPDAEEAPFANSEEEVSTSYILHGDNRPVEQVFFLNDDGSIIIDENTTFIDEEGNTIAIDQTELGNQEYTFQIKEENVSRDSTCEVSHNDAQEKLSEELDRATASIDPSNENALEAVSLEEDVRDIRDRHSDTTDTDDGSLVTEDKTNSEGNALTVVKKKVISILKRDGQSFLKRKIKSIQSGSGVVSRKIIRLEENPEEPKAVNVTCSIPEDVEIDNNTCRYCLKKFTTTSNKMRHIRIHHKLFSNNVGNCIRCIECNFSFKHVQKLRDHLQSVHELDMQQEEFVVPNMAAFDKWKHDIECKDLVSFTLRHGARHTPKGRKLFYGCHRSGKYDPRVGPYRKRMLKTHGTCKLGIVCTAAIYCEDRANEVFVKYCKHHYGHGKDTSFVQLSTVEQNAIQENISNGIPFESLLDDLRFGDSKDKHQMSLIKKKDIKFINTAFKAEEYNPGLSDAESVDRWVRLCCGMEDSPILFYRQDEVINQDEEFLLIIMTEYQKHILIASDKQVISLDSLHRRKGGRFYLTCLFVIDECDVAFPVAFCISNKVDKAVLKQFLSSIKESTGPLLCSYFMSDCEKFYYEAWQEVMGEESKWIWSMWYVDNRFRVQLRPFKGNVAKRAEVYRTFRMLLECQHPNVFETMFKNYIETLLSDPLCKNLGNFIKQKYENNKENWATCFQKDIKVSTIINLESLHRTLRFCCREGRKKRLDKFLFVIMKLVRYKMLQRLINTLDSERISLAIAAIDMCHGIGLEIPSDRISSLSDKIWVIKADDEEESLYVTRDFESCPEHCTLKCSECDICVHMFSCSCTHSMINANLCQHIHAVVWKFLTPHFSPIPSPAHGDDNEEIENIDISITPSNSSSELLVNVLKRAHDVYKKVRSNKNTMSEESLTAVIKRLNECIDICSGKKMKDDQPNTPDNNPVFVINNPLTQMKNLPPQPLLLPSSLPILPHNKSQYVLLLPNNCNNAAFVQK